MSYFSKERLREAVEFELKKDLTEREWEGVCITLDIEEPFHLEHADVKYDIPRIKRMIELLNR